jgi:transcriptional regulator with XRE-family HTH domain
MALAAGVDRSYFGKLERGERQPSLAILLRIAAALEVTGAELVKRTETALHKPKGRAKAK